MRIGIVGGGVIGSAHSVTLQALVDGGLADAAVVSVCDVHRERADALAARHPGARVAGDAEEVLDAVDAVYVCTPTASHRALVEAACARGVAVFCEKPLAPTLADAAAMTEAVASAGVINQVGLVLRSAPVFLALRDLLAGGELGRPMAAVFRDDQFFPIQGFYGSTWRADVRIAGAGTLLEHSVHDLDLLRFLLGDVEQVTARTANYAGHEGIEDVAVVTLAFASGATATLASVWHGVVTRPSTRRLEVFCERGVAWLDDDYTGPLHVETSAGDDVRTCGPDPSLGEDVLRRAGHYAAANRRFVEAVRAGAAATPDFADALAAHALADAAYESARSGSSPVTTT